MNKQIRLFLLVTLIATSLGSFFILDPVFAAPKSDDKLCTEGVLIYEINGSGIKTCTPQYNNTYKPPTTSYTNATERRTKAYNTCLARGHSSTVPLATVTTSWNNASFASIESACERFKDSVELGRGGLEGAMWFYKANQFQPTVYISNSDIKEDSVGKYFQLNITGRMWIYNDGDLGKSSFDGTKIQLVNSKFSGRAPNSSEQYKDLLFTYDGTNRKYVSTDTGKTLTVNRGNSNKPYYSLQWSTGNEATTVNVDLNKFISSNYSTVTNGDGYKEYTLKNAYIYRTSSYGEQGSDSVIIKIQIDDEVLEEKDDYSYASTTSTTSVSNATPSGGNTYKLSSTQNSSTIQFNHTVNSITAGGDAYYNKIHGMKYTIEVDGSEKKSTDGTQTSSQPTFNDSITVTVNPGETKQVCAYFNFEPTKLTVTTSGETTTFSEDGKGGSNKCVTIKREKVEETVTFKSESKVTSVSGATKVDDSTYVLPKDTDSTNIKFNHKASIKSGKSDYLDIASYTDLSRQIGSDKYSQTISGREQGTSFTVSVPEGQTIKVCESVKGSPEKAVIINYDKSNATKTGTFSSEACINIYRETNSEIQVKTETIINSDNNFDVETDWATKNNREAVNNSLENTPFYVASDLDTSSVIAKTTHSIKSSEIFSSVPWSDHLSINGSESSANKTADFSSKNSIKTFDSETKLCNASVNSGTKARRCTDTIKLGEKIPICRGIGSWYEVTKQYNGNVIPTEGTDIAARTCVLIARPYNFKLTPSVSIGDESETINYLTDSVDITVKIDNEKLTNQEGNHSYSPNETKVRIIRLIIDKSVEYNDQRITFNNPEINTNDICGLFSNINGDCSLVEEKTYNGTGDTPEGISHEGVLLKFEDEFDKSWDVGNKICYAAAVNYVDSESNEYSDFRTDSWRNRWLVSGLSCATTAKRPSFQVWGGSVYGAGKIAGAITRTTSDGETKIFGSWVDFGIVGKSNISKIASGASLAKGVSSSEESFCRYSPLTVSNYSCKNNGSNDSTLGNSGIDKVNTTAEKIFRRYVDNQRTIVSPIDSGSVILNDPASYTNFTTKDFIEKTDETDRYRYTHLRNNATISVNDSSVLDSGKIHIIYSEEKITIGSNLEYANGPYKLLSSIPQYIIIAEKGISIDPSVTNVDAWLVTPNGTLNTCTDHKEDNNVFSEKCDDQQLTINGPIFANKILLLRTAGAMPSDPGEPAEKFDMGATTFLWSQNQSQKSDQATTVHLRELAPRY